MFKDLRDLLGNLFLGLGFLVMTEQEKEDWDRYIISLYQ